MVHIDNGWDLALQQAWFGALPGTNKVTRSDWDAFGFGCYPFYGITATYGNLQDALDTIAALYGKPIQGVETDWPDLCTAAAVVDGGRLSEVDIPISVAGQIQWVQGVIGVVKEFLKNLGKVSGTGRLHFLMIRALFEFFGCNTM